MRRAVMGFSVALAAALPLSGCGGDSSSERAVRGAMQDYASALHGRDAARICARLAPAMASALLAELPLTIAPGKSCDVRLTAAFATAPEAAASAPPKVPIGRVKVHGAAASLTVGTGVRATRFQLVRAASGRWLVSCCTGAQVDRLASVINRVPSAGMEPTLKLGSIITVDQRAYRTAPPQIGDIVVFHPPAGDTPTCAVASEGHPGGRLCSRPGAGISSQRFVKRVVAGPGDTIALRDGHVVRNGRLVAEPFIQPCADDTECNFPTVVTIPPGTYYLLGDNRGLSDDSRFFGPIRRAAIVGRVQR